MNASTSSIGEMVNSSIVVLTKPGVSTFEQYERRGNLQSALIYVGIAAVIAALIGLLGGVGGAVSSFLMVFVNFLVFTGVTYYVGKTQGGTGTFDEVAYTFSLFWVPISVISTVLTIILTITIVGICLLPVVLLASLVASVYFAWLAVQSSMNLKSGAPVLITLGAAAVATMVVGAVVNSILT